MGTNYYLCLNHCECCKRSNQIHIMKSSFGWSAQFRGYDGQYGYITDSEENDIEVPTDFQLKSWKQWKEYLKDKPIIDEYGESISYDEFVEMVETYKSPNYVRDDDHKNKDHITEILGDSRYSGYTWEEYNDSNKHWHDEEGYSFSKRYFS
jgi:hypothetical protein